MRFLIAAVLLTAAFPLFALTLKDDLNRTVQLNHRAKRIIILSPDLVETAFAVGAEHQIVGVVLGSDYPAAAKSLRVVGSVFGLDLEWIARLHPDLILIWGSAFLRPLAPFIKAGVPVYSYDPKHIADVPRMMRRLGQLSGHEIAAEHAARAFEKTVKAAAKSPAKKYRVFIELNARPLMTVNGSDWMSEAISICGGENIFANVTLRAPTVDLESVIALHPDFIISLTSNGQTAFQSTTTFFHPKYITLPSSLLARPGPRLAEGITAVCHALI